MSDELDDKMLALFERQTKALELIAKGLTDPQAFVDMQINLGIEKNVRLRDAAIVRNAEKARSYFRVVELAGAGLTVDGGHHKQWFLEEILKTMGGDPEAIQHEPGIAP